MKQLQINVQYMFLRWPKTTLRKKLMKFAAKSPYLAMPSINIESYLEQPTAVQYFFSQYSTEKLFFIIKINKFSNYCIILIFEANICDKISLQYILN